ncbi:hypothetical protein ABPG72_012995 [Tetrahymena utriculariae]
MRTSTCENTDSQGTQNGLYQSQQQLSEVFASNITLPILQQLKLAYDNTSQQSNSSQFQASTESYLNQFNLILLSNQMSSFQNDLILNQLQQQTLSNLNSSNTQSRETQNSQISQFIQKQEKSKVDDSFNCNYVEQAKNSFPYKQDNTQCFAINNQNDASVEQNELSKEVGHITLDTEKRDNTYQGSKVNNSDSAINQKQQEEGNQVTRQQLLIGLMGLEQQLKKLQQQSQQKNSANCGSSTTSNQRYEDEENLSPICKQDKNNFASFDADPTPINRKRSGRMDTKLPLTQLYRQQSSNNTQSGIYSNSDILTPCKNVNIVNGGGSVFDSNTNTRILKNMSSFGNSMSNSLYNYQNQFTDINEFYLEDDEDNPKIETSTMSEAKSRDFNKIKEIVYFIVDNLDKDQEQLAAKRTFIQQDEHFSDNTSAYLIIFDQLVKKFKHLKKTKEEKTKFCMRKAFRYLFAQLKTNCNSKMNLKEANEICMKHYFSQHVNDSQFVLPFRRNSSIKTMNAAFLKKVFSSIKFVQDYRNFLNYFDRLALDDNSKKVDQLAYYILPMLEDNKFEKIDGLRRLPWTMNLLDSTRNLAFQLLEFEENTNVNGCQAFSQNQQNEFLTENAQSMNTNPAFLNSVCVSNEDQLSNVDTLSIQTQKRKISESCINMELLSRKQSICSSDSQQNSLHNYEIEFKQDGCFSDQHMVYLKQINTALQQFQQNWKIQQNLIHKSINKQIKREVIILSPPLYDLNENPYKKQQINFRN